MTGDDRKALEPFSAYRSVWNHWLGGLSESMDAVMRSRIFLDGAGYGMRTVGAWAGLVSSWVRSIERPR